MRCLNANGLFRACVVNDENYSLRDLAYHQHQQLIVSGAMLQSFPRPGDGDGRLCRDGADDHGVNGGGSRQGVYGGVIVFLGGRSFDIGGQGVLLVVVVLLTVGVLLAAAVLLVIVEVPVGAGKREGAGGHGGAEVRK